MLEGSAARDAVPVAAPGATSIMGMSAYMDMDALHALLGEGGVVSGASLLGRSRRGDDALYAAAEGACPAVAGVHA